MIQFKIGMAYATLAKNTSAIICARSKYFVTVKTVRPGSPDKIFRKKISVFTSSITDDYEYIKNDGLSVVWCNAAEFADEQPATAESTTSAVDKQPAHVATAESLPPDNLYMDESYSDAPGDNSRPDEDFPECHTPDTKQPLISNFFTENPKYPDYSSYPEAIHDDIPCVIVPACDIPALNPPAVVPERKTSTAEGFAFVLLKHNQLGFMFNTDCNPRQLWLDFKL